MLIKVNEKISICCGDPNDINCWSGTNFHILNMSKELSFKLEGLKLNPNEFSIHRFIWNFKQLFLNSSFGGFQFSDYFINNLSKQINIKANEENILISTYPLLPKISPESNWNIAYYIDATTKQIFDEYQTFSFISNDYRAHILNKERHNYKNAKIIFCMSEWVKESLIEDYKVLKEKIKILPAGANIQNKFFEK